MLILSLFGIVSAILVVTSTSTVFSVLWLIYTFIITSFLLGLLNLGFPSLLYIIVYIGAIAILFLFVVQLLDLNAKDEAGVQTNTDRKWTFTPLVILLSLGISASIIFITSINFNNGFNFLNIANINSFIQISPDINLVYSNNVNMVNISKLELHNLAEWLYGPGILPLLAISIILLISMVAPISLCYQKN